MSSTRRLFLYEFNLFQWPRLGAFESNVRRTSKPTVGRRLFVSASIVMRSYGMSRLISELKLCDVPLRSLLYFFLFAFGIFPKRKRTPCMRRLSRIPWGLNDFIILTDFPGSIVASGSWSELKFGLSVSDSGISLDFWNLSRILYYSERKHLMKS